MYVQIHAHKSNGSILGCTIVGEGAGDIISEITMAMVTGAKMDILVGRLSSNLPFILAAVYCLLYDR